MPESVPHDTVVDILGRTLKWWSREMAEVGVASSFVRGGERPSTDAPPAAW